MRQQTLREYRQWVEHPWWVCPVCLADRIMVPGDMWDWFNERNSSSDYTPPNPHEAEMIEKLNVCWCEECGAEGNPLYSAFPDGVETVPIR